MSAGGALLHSEAEHDEACALLSGCSFFRQLSDAEIAALAPCVSVLYLTESDEVVRRGQEASFFAVLLEGQLRLQAGDDLDALSCASDLSPGAVVGASGLFRGGVRQHDVRSHDDSTLAVM
eukprot:5733925-Prymnesium_polylepis.1